MTAPTPGSGLWKNQHATHPHLVTHGIAQEVGDVRLDINAVLKNLAAITVEEFTAPVAAVANAIKLAIATVAAPVTYSGAQLDGATGGAVMSPARNVTITTGGTTPADAPATAVINGLDANGKVIAETITVAQTGTIASGVKAFSKVTSIVLPQADGTGATLAFGFGSKIGLKLPVMIRTGATTSQPPIAEYVDHATPTAGVIDPTNGTYLPNALPNAGRNYAVYYEFDATSILDAG